MTTAKDIVRDAYVTLAADVLDAYGKVLERKAAGRSIAGLDEFKGIYNSRVAKLREKGKLGPKSWDKLRAAMPAEARPYFQAFGQGFDMTTDQGFAAFLGAIKTVSSDLAQNDRAAILSNFATSVASVFSMPQGEDEDEDEDED